MNVIQNAKTIPAAMHQRTGDTYLDYIEIEDFVYVGYPNDVSNGSLLELERRFTVSAQGEHKDGAWAFIRFALSEQEQGKGRGFPVNDAAMRRSIGDQVALKKYDAQDAQKFYDALYAATALCNACPEISAIVLEEGAGYLNDQLTARQAAENIQSRVHLYLMEQAG